MKTISRNQREGVYLGRRQGQHQRGHPAQALRRWKPRKTIDKSKWDDGEWQAEPDTLYYQTAEGFQAVILRTSHSGVLCGYVGVPQGHPWWRKQYHDVVTPTAEQLQQPIDTDKISVFAVFVEALSGRDDDSARIDCLVHVHGGLTYSDRGWPSLGEDPRLWFFGFDCAHAGDYNPAYDYKYGWGEGQYRNLDYVKSEIAALSAQLAGVKP